MTDFSRMTLAELRAYVKAHRTDDEAIHELFVNRRNPNAKVYPYNQSGEEIEEILRRKINGEL